MSEDYKICPICDARSPRTAAFCSQCGSSLANVGVTSASQPKSARSRMEYDYHYGEADLYEDNLRRTGNVFLLGGVLTFAVVSLVALLIIFAPGVLSSLQGGTFLPGTPLPTSRFATVTDSPPTFTPTVTPPATDTATATATESPCVRTVQTGDTLLSIVLSCGHRDQDVMEEVMEINNITNPSLLQLGQTVIVPYPTPTIDPNLTPSATAEGDAGTGDTEAVSFADESGATIDPFLAPTSTLPPGVTYHTVQPGENILTIAFNYGADIEILSQLNPEVTFSQCDFGEYSGGPNCIVQIFEGQQIRVPAPTPTPTLPPTSSGSETPTPTATATFNAPSATSPGNLAHFQRDELITLRWLGSGSLVEGQTYRVQVENLTDNTEYIADTTQISFIIPDDWQGREDRRYQYRWSISVIDIDRPDAPYFTTESRTFTWQGRGGS